MKKTETKSNSEEKIKILLIEDDRLTRRMVRAFLQDRYDVCVAGNVALGTHLYRNMKPDIVLMDADLPDGSGYSLLQRVIYKDPQAHVIMFTGHGNTDHIFKSIALGAKGFMLKPFDPGKMETFVRKWEKQKAA